MKTEAIVRIAEAMQKGDMPDVPTWDIGAAVRVIVDSLGRPDAWISVDAVRLAAKALNKQRHFDHTRMLGQAWSKCHGFDATIEKHHVQALVNLSSLDQAEQLVKEGLIQIKLPGVSAQTRSELLEYEGLLGRIYKQRYVATGNLDLLEKATKQYFDQYNTNPDRLYWHGINAVALRAREEREGVDQTGLPSSEALATAVYEMGIQLYCDNPKDPFLFSTLSEAALALGKCDESELWLYRFLHHPAVQPFDIQSYDRQLREIWQGSASGGGAECPDRLVGIISRHIARTQSQWSVSAAAVPAMARALAADPSSFEKNFSGEGSFSVDIVKRMLGVCASIGCVCNRNGERLGTGFLVDGASLKESYGVSRPVFVTNAHVISESVENAIRLQDARVTFEMESESAGGPVFYEVEELLFTSLPGDLGVRGDNVDKLDVSIVRLKALPDRFKDLKMAGALPLVKANTKAYVVGHPRGSGLQISLHDSVLLDIDDNERLVHYRTPTDPGSSGSPVFNGLWEVIALHHAGSTTTPRLHGNGTYEANEGIALSAIRRVLCA